MAMDYIPVKINKLPDGLFLDCKIYIEKDGAYAFFCENVNVTDSLVERLNNAVAPYDTIYITAHYMEEFFNRGIDLGWKPKETKAPEPEAVKPAAKPPSPFAKGTSQVDFERVKKEYTESKQKTKKLFDEISKTRKVDTVGTEEFVHEIGRQLETNNISLILQSINSMRDVDEYLHAHSLNVAFLNGLMARWLKYDKKHHDELVKAGLLHDIGKLVIPQSIINKPGRLTPEEFDVIKKHSLFSFEMLVNSGITDKAILLGIVQHHEKLNGSGYPHGIDAKEISDYARITAISDIYDAMIAKRVYKDAHSPFDILANFSKEGYSVLDINYVKIFIDCMIEELKGKQIVLSDGRIATVLMVNERNLMYPMVDVDGEVITTSPELHCVSIFNHNVSSEEVEKIV